MYIDKKQPVWHLWPYMIFLALCVFYVLVQAIDYWADQYDRAISNSAKSVIYSCAESLECENLIVDIKCYVRENELWDSDNIQPYNISRINHLAINWNKSDIEMAAFLHDLLSLLNKQYGMNLISVNFYCFGSYVDKPMTENMYSFNIRTSTSELLSMSPEEIVHNFIIGQY